MADGDAKELYDDVYGLDELARAPRGPGERAINYMLKEMELARTGKHPDGLDADDVEFMEPELLTACIRATYEDEDPYNVPIKDMKHALRYPVEGSEVPPKYLERINGPTNAIRAKCSWCMGGNMSLVSGCATVNCPLWPFRMGTNPFYARLANTDDDADVVENEAELAAMDAAAEEAQAARLANVTVSDNNDGD